MTIQDWGAVGEIVGAIGVILTLIYLATQIRHNTRQLRSEGHQGITDSYNQWMAQLLVDPVLFETVIRASQDWDSVSALQQAQAHIFFHQHLMSFRMAYQLRDKGAIDDDVYRSFEETATVFMANPGHRAWWAIAGESLIESQLARKINARLAALEGSASATTEAWSFFDPEQWPSPPGTD